MRVRASLSNCLDGGRCVGGDRYVERRRVTWARGCRELACKSQELLRDGESDEGEGACQRRSGPEAQRASHSVRQSFCGGEANRRASADARRPPNTTAAGSRWRRCCGARSPNRPADLRGELEARCPEGRFSSRETLCALCAGDEHGELRCAASCGATSRRRPTRRAVATGLECLRMFVNVVCRRAR